MRLLSRSQKPGERCGQNPFQLHLLPSSPGPVSTPPAGFSDSQSTLLLHLLKADCGIPFSACVLVAPNVQSHSRAQFSSAPSNHPSKPCANGTILESFPEALVEPIAPPTPSLSFYHSSCPWASIVSLPAFLLPKAACTSCKDIFRLSPCAWPLPAVSL